MKATGCRFFRIVSFSFRARPKIFESDGRRGKHEEPGRKREGQRHGRGANAAPAGALDVRATQEESVSLSSGAGLGASDRRGPLQGGRPGVSQWCRNPACSGSVPVRRGWRGMRALHLVSRLFLSGEQRGKKACPYGRTRAERGFLRLRAGGGSFFPRQVLCCRLNKKSRKGCADGVMPSGLRLQKKSVRRQWKDVLPEVSGERRFSD